ncbi:secreted protein [marine sediment metagenome]|uniref:Secreted protein n=1 Tax=marine sediment metagenome TaxID=412755 RepID=A0A1B6NVM0_9ZZZZ
MPMMRSSKLHWAISTASARPMALASVPPVRKSPASTCKIERGAGQAPLFACQPISGDPLP